MEGPATTTGRPAPVWSPPSKDGRLVTGLQVHNSLTGGKVEFIPINGRTVLWYGCGPTVYDAAHMGHARTYLVFDALRRIMSDYFGYSVVMCMNITDIDDKIIQRSVEQNKPFSEFARYWENHFFKDMKALNILLPDMITRVSEYISEIVVYIQKILDNQFAYLSNGSIYFDTQNFIRDDRFYYGRMEPGSVTDTERVLEGEGALTAVDVVNEKRAASDFALWKKAKEGEPSWDSPWGKGRPGWHIECSAMASEILGFPIDIHSGGIDLRFPHHDNELAQCEAHDMKPQWVNYFLHSGHLDIQGRKMSKSLKNFVTISDVLQEYSARCVRLLCLMHRWDAPMDYAPDGSSMGEASTLDKTFLNFFANVKSMLRSAVTSTDQMLRAEDLKLFESTKKTEETIHEALIDNFNTPNALTSLQSLVSNVNVYMANNTPVTTRMTMVLKAARVVFRILRIFGVTNGSDHLLNYIDDESDLASTESQAKFTSAVDSFTAFRNDVRLSARATLQTSRTTLKEGGTHEQALEASATSAATLLKKCDEVRDEDLVELGVQLEDKGNVSSWKSVPKEIILAERIKKTELEAEQQEKRRVLKEAEEKKKAQKEAEAAVPPQSFYRTFNSDMYSEFDEEGIPLTTGDGAPVSKSMKDKAKKFLEKHMKVHQVWLEKQQH
eukprot:Lankesteria_metandrocarpae@DN2404_c0_g1_i1.p1